MKKLFMKKGIFVCIGMIALLNLYGQEKKILQSEDTIKPLIIDEVRLIVNLKQKDKITLPDVVGTEIFAGKKNDLLMMDKVQGNNLNNVMRQLFSKVSGIHIWESEGSGIQIGVSTRGLSPNRSSEFNVRQNGVEIAADPYSYSEAYYNPQLQGVQKIQIVRGAGALQYGTQFGGMINYIMKDGSTMKKPFEFETQQSLGSYGLYNAFNALGGTINQFHYYGFVDYRRGDGWRQNSKYDIVNAYFSTHYHLTKNIKMSAEFTSQNMLSQQAGGLTDSLFLKNHRQSVRSRNWFQINWNILACNIEWQWLKNNFLNFKIAHLNGARKSIGFQVGNMSIKDTINTQTLNYNHRDIEIQKFKNVILSLKNRWVVDNLSVFYKNIVVMGVQYFNGHSPLKTSKKGSIGMSDDFDIPENSLVNDYDRTTENYSAFFENAVYVTKNFIVTPGFRFEHLKNSVSGTQEYTKAIHHSSPERNISLGGVSIAYKLPLNTELYGNFTQAYKPLWYGNITTLTTNTIDQNIKDSKGHTMDIGFKGDIQDAFIFDMSLFYISYRYRLGALTLPDKNTLLTNVGDSKHCGLESFVEIDWTKIVYKNKSAHWSFKMYGTYSFTKAVYQNFKNPQGVNLKGRYVSDAPQHIFRAGVHIGYQKILLSYQFSTTSLAYSDAQNSSLPNAQATAGVIPGYRISDLTFQTQVFQNYTLKCGVNNAFNARYFTRRASGFPGSGILPGEGRTVFLTFGARF